MDWLVADATALLQVVLIDLALAGDNAVAVGLAAAALPVAMQRRVIFWGILLALILRIIFATGVKWMLQIDGVLLVGGLLLFWVAWRMLSDLLKSEQEETPDPSKAPASMWRALGTIIVADVSMSLDNVIAVAGVARHSADWILWFGLVLSVLLMGIAATFIARMIKTHVWIAYVGLLLIVLTAIRMVWEDGHHFLPAYIPALPPWLSPPHPPA